MKSLKAKIFFVFILSICLSSNGFTLEIGGILQDNVSLKPESNPHILKSTLTIPKDITLNIEAGTIIKVQKGTNKILIYGNCNAVGTSDSPIIITSDELEPKSGDWDYIAFHQGSTGILKYVTIEYAGEGGNKSLYLHSSILLDHVTIKHGSIGIEIIDSAAPTISNCEIGNMTKYGINASSSGNYKIINSSLNGNIGALNISLNKNTPIITGNNYTGSGNHESAMIEGTITGDMSFDNNVMLNGSVSVAQGATLTFSPGITIFAKNTTSRLMIYGALYAEANGNTDRIMFTSDELEPKAGDWDYIEFHQGSFGVLKYVTIEYAGEGGNKSLYLHSSIELDHVTIRHGYIGIEILDSAMPLIQNCVITDMSSCGILSKTNKKIEISNNAIYNNGSGVYTTSGIEIDARKVYWGHESGPYHPDLNPSGQGNEVSDNVVFEPWLRLEKGDLNCDNSISLADAIIALQICVDSRNNELIFPSSFINNKADLKTAIFITMLIANSE